MAAAASASAAGENTGADAKHPKDVLNDFGRLDLRDEARNWFLFNLTENVPVQIILPLDDERPCSTSHWRTECSESVEVLSQETIKQSRHELLIVRITCIGGVHWLALRKCAKKCMQPEKIITFCAWPPLPKPGMNGQKASASAQLAIPIIKTGRPVLGTHKVYRAEIKPRQTVTLRLIAPFVQKPQHGFEVYFRFGAGMDVQEQGWEHNRYATAIDALGVFALGCVQQVTIKAFRALQPGEHCVKIFCSDPDDEDEELPHAIVLLTADMDVTSPDSKKTKADSGAAGGSAVEAVKHGQHSDSSIAQKAYILANNADAGWCDDERMRKKAKHADNVVAISETDESDKVMCTILMMLSVTKPPEIAAAAAELARKLSPHYAGTLTKILHVQQFVRSVSDDVCSMSSQEQRSYSDVLKAYVDSRSRQRCATVAYERRYGQLSRGSDRRVRHTDTYTNAMRQDAKALKIPETTAELHHARIAAQLGASLEDEQALIQEQERLKTAAFSYSSSDEGMM